MPIAGVHVHAAMYGAPSLGVCSRGVCYQTFFCMHKGGCGFISCAGEGMSALTINYIHVCVTGYA